MNTKQLNSVVGYARISTERHLADADVLLSTQQCLKQYGVSSDLFFWDMESGFSDKRRGYDDILALIAQGNIQKVVVYCFDYFRGNTLQWQDFFAILSHQNIEVVLVGEGRFLHIDGVGNVLADTIHQSVLAKQRHINRQNSERGHEKRRQQQKPFVVPFGYVLNENAEVAINLALYKDSQKSYYAIARELIDCFLDTESVSQTLAALCDLYGYKRVGNRNLDFPRDPKALKNWLLSPFLRGTLVFFPKDPTRRIEHPLHHPAIITEKEALQIHLIMERRKIIKKTDTLANPLIDLIFCAGCGSPMKVSQSKGSSNSEYHYYLTCKGAYPKVGHPKVCDRRSSYGLEISDVISFVIGALSRASERIEQCLPPDSLDKVLDTPEILALKSKIEKIEALNFPEMILVINQLKTELEGLIAQKLREHNENNLAFLDLQSILHRPNIWRSILPEELRTICPLLVKRVICDEGQVAIELLV